MSGVGATATHACLLRARRWNIVPFSGITQQMQMKYEMKNSNPHNAQRKKPQHFVVTAVSGYLLIDSSTPPRQVPQISLTLTPARETEFLLCATLAM